VVFDLLAVDNFDFKRKIVKKKIWVKNPWKCCFFCQNWIFGQKFDFSNSVLNPNSLFRCTYIVFFEVSRLSQSQFCHINNVVHEIIIWWRHIVDVRILVSVSELPLVFQATWIMPIGFTWKNRGFDRGCCLISADFSIDWRSKKGCGTDCLGCYDQKEDHQNGWQIGFTIISWSQHLVDLEFDNAGGLRRAWARAWKTKRKNIRVIITHHDGCASTRWLLMN